MDKSSVRAGAGAQDVHSDEDLNLYAQMWGACSSVGYTDLTGCAHDVHYKTDLHVQEVQI